MQNQINEEKTHPLFYVKEKYVRSEKSKISRTRENVIATIDRSGLLETMCFHCPFLSVTTLLEAPFRAMSSTLQIWYKRQNPTKKKGSN